jgi:NitT/TauT family transport system substrate-binding protein
MALTGTGIAVLSGLLMRQPVEVSVLTIPQSPWPGFAYFNLAHRLGLDQRHGLRIDSVNYDDGQMMVEAYLEGRLPLVQVSNVEAVEICRRQPKRCPRVVLVLDSSAGADRLVVRTSSLGLEDLRGRRVGVTPFGLGPYVLNRALATAGMDLKDVEQVRLHAHAMPQALAWGQVEAAVLYSPFSEQAVRLGFSRVVFDSRQMPGELCDLLVVEPKYYERNRSAIIRLLRAWQDAHDWARAHPAEARQKMAPDQQLSEAGLAQAEQGVEYLNLQQQRAMLAPLGLVARNLEMVRSGLVDLGRATASTPLPLVIDEPVRKALQPRGNGPFSP